MNDLAHRMARFGRALRGHGVPTTLRDELDGALAFGLVDPRDHAEVRTALKISMRVPRSAFGLFDRLFGVFWDDAPVPEFGAPRHAQKNPTARRSAALLWDPDSRQMGVPEKTDNGGKEQCYSPDAVLRRKSFDDSWSERDLLAMERLLARMSRRLRTRRSRRLVPTRGRGPVDLRASYRRSLRTSGELIALSRRARAIERARIVFLVDTSGSMDTYVRFLLSFLLALRRAVPGAEAFAMNTELVRLTPALMPGKLQLSLERMAKGVPDWSGGTRLGSCLENFAERYLNTVDARTVVVILSDGLDQGDVGALSAAVRKISSRARRLIWLNPLMGDSRYEPTAAGMRAALPFIDHLASAHDLASLERVVPELRV